MTRRLVRPSRRSCRFLAHAARRQRPAPVPSVGWSISQSDIASQIGFQVIQERRQRRRRGRRDRVRAGGHASDRRQHRRRRLHRLSARRPASRRRSTSAKSAPAGSPPEMWLDNGKYDTELHHNSHRAVGVPGTVAGLHLAWKTHGSSPGRTSCRRRSSWRATGSTLARPGAFARGVLATFKKYPASLAQFSQERQARTKRASCSSSPTSPARCSASPSRGRTASTKAKPPH